MSKITLDSQLRSKLNGLNEQVEVCDETGTTLGQFLPQARYKELMYAWAKTLFSDEDLAKARAETGGFSTTEAIDYLEHFGKKNQGAS